MGYFPKGVYPVTRVYINLLLEKRTQIKPENNDRFRIQWRASLLYYNCLSQNVITSISCGLRTLEEEIHIESDYIVWDFARSKVPYKWKNGRSPTYTENFIYHVTFWPTVRSMKAAVSLERNTCLPSYPLYFSSWRESIIIVQNEFHRNSLLHLNYSTTIGIFNFEWAYNPSATTKYPTRKRYQSKRI